ncbi:MAG: DUF1223 domain-containing protein [Chthoniobacterales bacterium]
MLLLSLMAAMAASPVVFESGENQATLVELYTSEGCSSCPPAEAQLAKLRDDPKLWQEVVPVAFHVSYWDNLGWPDRFASSAFTQRQRDYAARWQAGTIYTPAFVSNGHEGTAAAIGSPVGKLRAEVESPGEVAISFRPAKAISGPLVAEVAPLANDVVSDVRRGENAGRKLPHEFVALALISAPLESRNGEWAAKVSLPRKTEAPISALAVWVHPANDPTPIQATGGWLKK